MSGGLVGRMSGWFERILGSNSDMGLIASDNDVYQSTAVIFK